VANWLSDKDKEAVAVLAAATQDVLGPDAPVVHSLNHLLRDRSRSAYYVAAEAFDRLEQPLRQRIADSAPGLARRRSRKNITLPGLLGALNRR
jgi:hypothetical protein